VSLVGLVVLLFGLLLCGLGVAQLVTGRNTLRALVGMSPDLPPSPYRALGAMYVFFGLLVTLEFFDDTFGRVGHAVLVTVLGVGAAACGTWAFVVLLVHRSVRGGRP
jgi:hypothetical protein